MSVVTNMIFTFSSTDKNIIFNINKWLNGREYGELNAVADMAGGYKFFESQIFIAAFNHFFLDDFIDFIKSLAWNDPCAVQIFIKKEFDSKFRIIEMQQ